MSANGAATLIWYAGFFALCVNGRTNIALIRGGSMRAGLQGLLSTLEVPALISMFVLPFLALGWVHGVVGIVAIFLLAAPLLVSRERLPFFIQVQTILSIAGLLATGYAWWSYLD